jgi:predicted metal-dependent phosphoesterase TrpH
MFRVEFHCHSRYSKDCLTSPKTLLETCRRKKIDRVVITDHNTIAGARHTWEMDPERVIVGEEINTLEGELLCAYVKEEVPAGLPALEAIDLLRGQGAFVSVSHPFDRMRKGHWDLPDLLEIASLVDAIETFNSRCFLPEYNRKAADFAKQHGLLGTVGSDAHTAFEVGQAVMSLPTFDDPAGLIEALRQARHETRLSGFWVHLASRYAVWRKKISAQYKG